MYVLQVPRRHSRSFIYLLVRKNNKSNMHDIRSIKVFACGYKIILLWYVGMYYIVGGLKLEVWVRNMDKSWESWRMKC